VRAAVVPLALVVLTACGQGQRSVPQPGENVAPAAVASPSLAAAVSLASPSPSPVAVAAVTVASPSPRALQASPSAQRVRVPLRLSVALDPTTPTVGQTFTLTLAITNAGTRPAEGVYISTSGPWDRYTVLSVRPSGAFVRDATGWHFGSPLRVGPGETQSLTVEVRPEQQSDEQLNFAVREADPGELP
jgi:hypothetical protein